MPDRIVRLPLSVRRLIMAMTAERTLAAPVSPGIPLPTGPWLGEYICN
jgi:hypothetical protein